MSLSTKYKIKVSSEKAGVRLDAFVVSEIKNISRSQIKRLIEGQKILINSNPAKAARIVAKNDLIEIELLPPSKPNAVPEEIPLDVIYEDSDLIVVNKPAGMVVHPAAGHPNGTLVNALLAHCGDLSGIGGELKAGIVHRLDKGTSGAIVAAKNDEAHKSLAAQFKARTVTKIYLALVFGLMRTETGSFNQPIGRSKTDRKRMSGRTQKGRDALTEWKVLKRFGKELSWIEIRLRTGRMHQIRVHFTEAGHPLVGDLVYGGTKKAAHLREGELRNLIAKFSRPVLHAWRIGFDHPRTQKRIELEAKLPEDIKELLEKLHTFIALKS